MISIAKIRHSNLELILSSFTTHADFARAVGKSGSQISQLRPVDKDGNPKSAIGEKLARKIEEGLELPTGWMDSLQSTFRSSNRINASLTSVNGETRTPESNLTGIQHAVLDTARRLIEAGLLGEMECLALLQTWQPMIAKLNESPSVIRGNLSDSE